MARVAFFHRLFMGNTRVLAVLSATMLLAIAGSIVAPTSVSAAAILGMLPLLGILAVAALGQHLVIQQRGLDLSVPGAISLAAVIVTSLPGPNANVTEMVLFAAFAIAAAAGIGFANGLLATRFRVPAIIATIGTNAVAFGICIWLARGVPRQGPASLTSFGRSALFGVPLIPALCVVCVVAIAIVLKWTVLGRQVTAVAVNAKTASLLGLPVGRIRIGVYISAGLLYGVAGVLLAAHLVTPPVLSGSPYVLASVAAVVLGGNSIAGGAAASIVSTALGAVFLTYLSQLVLSAGMPVSAQAITQGVIVLCSALVATRGKL